jgi:quercetin dioxygenase-like cupin family protein
VRRWDLTSIDTPGGTRSPVVLHTSEEARAVLIGIEAGQELGDHQVKENAWLVVVDGEVEVDADGGAFTAGPGTLLAFAPDERHAVRSADGARVLLLLAPWPGEGHYRGGGVGARSSAGSR